MRRWLVTIVLAVAGLAALGPLVERLDQSQFWHLRLDRAGAIAEARRLAGLQGVDARGWDALCRMDSTNIRSAFEQFRRAPVHPLFSVVEYEVLLTHPGGKQSAWVRLNSQGRPVGFELLRAPGQPLPGAGPAPEEVLRLYAGPFGEAFQPENEGVAQGMERVHSWTWPAPDPSEATVRLELTYQREALLTAKLTPQLPAEFQRRYSAWRESQVGLMGTLVLVATTLVMFAAFPVFFRAWSRNWFPHGWLVPAYLFFSVPVALGAWYWLWMTAAFTAREAYSSLWSQTGAMLAWLAIPAMLVVLWGAGRALATDADLARWFSLEALFTRRWTRPTGVALVGGVLCGLALACLPFVGTLLPGPGRMTAIAPARYALAVSPWLAPFDTLLYCDVWALFLFLWPARNHVKFRWLGWLLFCVAGMVALGTFRDLYDFWLARNFVAALAITLGSLAIYWAFDLLAVIAAQISALAVSLAVVMSFQPAGLRMDALSVMLLPALLLALGLVAMATGQAVNPAEEIARQRAEVKETASDRDRLRAEFGVARKAQVGMLPEIPERVGATTLAASCHPARDVGGDLYDFFECPDGRYGFCVADVSGKGVPAALYMSLTKGILAAASWEGAPIRQVLATLNRHLLTFGKRKMFVTMSLGYYDAARRELEHARAGHNPPLIWRASRGEGEFLKPRGVGLGLAGDAPFGRTLEVQRVQLETDDIVVFYSDGIVEAMNVKLEQFGEERLLEAVRDCASWSATAVETEISRRVRLFAGSAPVHDDQTLFILRVG